ncbi:hypothetical protein [Corynebacterium qintianiae]|uniref:hypothetical protein n=1 Tax=Corynebacterium qintianiae TaxID=2709392 RepID=UPI0013EC7342|nr:hypothetical protein [Corynebacterium qintianiae]
MSTHRTLDSIQARHHFKYDVERIATRYRNLLPQGWEDALQNVLDVIDKDQL